MRLSGLLADVLAYFAWGAVVGGFLVLVTR